MIGLVELAANLWIFGLPVVAAVWSLLRLAEHAPGRLRYMMVVAGFVGAVALPITVSLFGAEPVTGTASALDPATPSVIAWIWMAGTTVLIVRELGGHLRLAVRRYERPPVALLERLEWPHDVPLRIGGTAPMTAGLLRPWVALPAALAASLDYDTARAVARHELAHARWRDPLVHALLRMIACAVWIAPVWPLLQWARREREVAADEAALRGVDAGRYVSALVELSRALVRERPPGVAIAGSDLEHRARRILGESRRLSFLAIAPLVLSVTAIVFAEPARYSIDRGDREEKVIRQVIRR